MSDQAPAREQMERAMRSLLQHADLPEPDEVLPHEDGGIVCLWHAPRLAIIVDPNGREVLNCSGRKRPS